MMGLLAEKIPFRRRVNLQFNQNRYGRQIPEIRAKEIQPKTDQGQPSGRGQTSRRKRQTGRRQKELVSCPVRLAGLKLPGDGIPSKTNGTKTSASPSLEER